MPGKKKDKDKAKSIPIQPSKPKGVLEIVVPAKNADVKPTVTYDYFKCNASYSENNDNSMDEETKLIKLQIEQRLNEMLQVPYEIKLPKTDNESNTAKVEDTKKLEKSTDSCFSLLSKAVSQVPGVVKKPEKEIMLGVKEKPKRDILVPLEKVKNKDEDFFKGTRVVKEKKSKPKKQVKVMHFHVNEVIKPPSPVEIQPVVVNRWQEKEGSKLFNPERDEEDEELQLAIKESLKEEQKRAKQLIQEELLYYELTRQAKKQKNEERGNKLQNVLKNHSWNSADGAKSLDNFDKKFEESRNETVSNGDGWDDEIDLVRHEIDERQAKKERVKKNLKDKLKLLDNYGPLLDDEKEKEILVKEGVKEKNKSVKKVGDEEVEELVFVDVDVSDEEDKKKVPYDWSKPVKEIRLLSEKNIQWNVTKKSDVLEKKMENLTFNDIEENEDEEFRKKATLHLNQTKSKLRLKDTSKNLSVVSDIRGLPPRDQRPVNERKKLDTKSQEVKENVFEEPSQKTVPKTSLWNSTATSENRGFSKEYQTKRRETINKTTKSNPSQNELFSDIPKLNDNVSELVEGPFKDFEPHVPDVGLNDLNIQKVDEGIWKRVDATMVANTLQEILHQQATIKQGDSQNLLNFLQVPQNNLQNNNIAQLNSLQQSTGLDLSCLFNNTQQGSNLNLGNLGIQQASCVNLPGMGSVQQTQAPNLQASDLNFLNVLNATNSVQLPDVANFQQCQFPNQQQIPDLQNVDLNNLKQQATLSLFNMIKNGGLQQASGVNMFDGANVQYNQVSNMQQATDLNLANMVSVEQNQVSNMQQASSLNLLDMTSVQQSQISSIQQATGLNLSGSTSIEHNQVSNMQQVTGLNLPGMTSVQQSQISNLQQATGLDLPDMANVHRNQNPYLEQASNLQQTNDLSSITKSQECLNTSEQGNQEPTSDKNSEYEKLMCKIKNLQEQLAKEQEEKKLLMEQQLVQNQAELSYEEQVEEELPLEGQTVDQQMGPMMMPNPYLQYQTTASPGLYPNRIPMFYPIVPPANHLPLPTWIPPTPYMGPVVYNQPYLRKPQ